MKSPEVKKYHIGQLLISMQHPMMRPQGCPLYIVDAQQTFHWLEALIEPPAFGVMLGTISDLYQFDKFIVFGKIAAHDRDRNYKQLVNQECCYYAFGGNICGQSLGVICRWAL